MALLVPTMRYALRKALQGLLVDPISYLAGNPTGASPVVAGLTAQAEVDYMDSIRMVSLNFSDANTAGTTIAEEAVYVVDPASSGGIKVLYAVVSPTTAVTASTTLYAGMVLNKRTTAAGIVGAAKIILSNSTNTTDLVFGATAGSNAFAPFVMTPATAQTASSGVATAGAVANSICLPGDVLTFALTKASTGTALGINVAFTLFIQEL
jgi:hypothetical protein